MSIRNFISNLPISAKFKQDVAVNVLSLVFLGLGGIILNILIARFYGAENLGFFNKVYALYMFTSQIAVGSVHLSLQKYLAQENKTEHSRIVSAGLVATSAFALVAIALIFLSRNFWANLLHDEEIALSIVYILPGLLAFALNKSLLAVLNGLRQMKSFAFFQTLRYFLLIIIALAMIALREPSAKLPFIFTFSEIILLFFSLGYTSKFFEFLYPANWGKWLVRHFDFSYKSLLGHIFTDINARVGVLVLSYFSSNREVGIFSFAAIFADGFNQLMVVLKLNVNPILASLSRSENRAKLNETIRQGIRLTYSFTLIIGAIAILVYPLIIRLFVPKAGFESSWPIFALIAAAYIVAGGYQPFQMLPAQLGRPSLYTLLVGLVFAINLVLGVLLAPAFGMIGVALASAGAIISSAIILKIMAKKYLRLRI